MLEEVFRSKTCEQQIDYRTDEQCPLLIGVFRQEGGSYSFNRLVDESIRGLDLNKFLAGLMDFKENFHSSKRKMADIAVRLSPHFEARQPTSLALCAKEEPNPIEHLLQKHERDLQYRLMRSDQPEFLRATLLLSGIYDDETSISRHAGTASAVGPPFMGTRSDSDHADDEDDCTPTINRSMLKFP